MPWRLIVLPIFAVLIGTSATAQLVSEMDCEMSRRKLPGWFCEIDAKGVGVIRPVQFVAHQLKLFDRLDKDADGVLTLDDYLQLAEIPFLEGRHLPSVNVLRNQARRGFRACDIDGDGKVSRIEFEAGAWGAFDAFDRNRDGQLTPDDWPLPSPVSRAPQPRPTPDRDRDRLVDDNEFVTFETAPIWDLDINRDGRIVLEEWLRGFPI